ncbi:hypothetical protein [Pseudonocardia humida]|uniref:Uncharacterized protein n=1 Tax=Pseudonocardia humida TaxID=2800819 RepID=A0ABT1A469_9PSEU|nr:hypothetical protein [Pseudonocardia humida]MCO1657741.1 hypothetical protein [Pseudonocardia humida]
MSAPGERWRGPTEIVPLAAAVRRHRPRGPLAADEIACVRCRARATWGSADLCLWWPSGCYARPGVGAVPSVCWSCSTEDERLDLVDLGCVRATLLLRKRTGR